MTGRPRAEPPRRASRTVGRAERGRLPDGFPGWKRVERVGPPILPAAGRGRGRTRSSSDRALLGTEIQPTGRRSGRRAYAIGRQDAAEEVRGQGHVVVCTGRARDFVEGGVATAREQSRVRGRWRSTRRTSAPLAGAEGRRSARSTTSRGIGGHLGVVVAGCSARQLVVAQKLARGAAGGSTTKRKRCRRARARGKQEAVSGIPSIPTPRAGPFAIARRTTWPLSFERWTVYRRRPPPLDSRMRPRPSLTVVEAASKDPGPSPHTVA